MVGAHIFIVEDEPSIAQTVQFALESEGFEVTHFATGTACLQVLESQHPSLVLLDVGLADGNGFDFFRGIRQLSSVPVIFLTARSEEIDRVVGLEMGADDYIVKPFSLREVVARVRAVLRRSAPSHASGHAETNLSVEDLSDDIFTIDSIRRQIHYKATPLQLTLHEYRLIEILIKQPGRVFTRDQLLQQAWENPDHRLERTVDSHIKSLRTKLRAVDADARPIRTHRGLGYSLDLKK